MRLIRRLFAIVIAAALIGAPVEASAVMPCDTIVATALDHQLSSGQAPAPTPCKKMMPGCPDMFGCGIAVGLPDHLTGVALKLIWTSSVYWAAADAHEGLSVEPDLGPPITI